MPVDAPSDGGRRWVGGRPRRDRSWTESSPPSGSDADAAPVDVPGRRVPPLGLRGERPRPGLDRARPGRPCPGSSPPRRHRPAVTVDRDLASAWFAWSLRPDGWEVPAPWDAVAGDYAGEDGWIKLHTNAPQPPGRGPRRPRRAGRTIGGGRRRGPMEGRGPRGRGGGVGRCRGRPALGRSLGRPSPGCGGGRRASASTSNARRRTIGDAGRVDPARPLAGVRVLDLTRVLAGPVATRLLAGWGAEVLRIDPPGWDEPGDRPRGDPREAVRPPRPDGRRSPVERFLELLAGADVLVHGYRPGALDGLGLGPDVRDAARPGLVDVSLDAYGWTGPVGRSARVRQPRPDELGHRPCRHGGGRERPPRAAARSRPSTMPPGTCWPPAP